jgi:hypothetical protein
LKCGCENDFTTLKKEEKVATPKMYEMGFVDYVGGEVKPGDTVIINTEFDKNNKFKSFLVGEIVLASGEKRLMSLNKTSYINIASVYGKDTKTWLTKRIQYRGEEKIKSMLGRVWVAVK